MRQSLAPAKRIPRLARFTWFPRLPRNLRAASAHITHTTYLVFYAGVEEGVYEMFRVISLIGGGINRLSSWPLVALLTQSSHSRIQLGQSLADGILRQLRHAVQVELFHQLPAMGFDGFHAHPQIAGNFLGC